MKKIDLPLWSDTVFFFVCIWLLSLCILRYYRVTMWLAVVLCTLIALALGAGIFLLMYRSRKKKFLLQRDKEEKEKLMLHLALSSAEANEKLFAPLLAGEKQKTYLLFCMQPLSADTIAEKIRRSPRDESFSVFCNILSPEARILCEEFAVEVTEANEVYAALKQADRLPEKYICSDRKRRGFKEKFKIGFRKKNSRSFFFGGAALLVLSLFSFFPLYYVISGSLLVLTALIVRIFGYA